MGLLGWKKNSSSPLVFPSTGQKHFWHKISDLSFFLDSLLPRSREGQEATKGEEKQFLRGEYVGRKPLSSFSPQQVSSRTPVGSLLP